MREDLGDIYENNNGRQYPKGKVVDNINYNEHIQNIMKNTEFGGEPDEYTKLGNDK